jgi:hypothetical protein
MTLKSVRAFLLGLLIAVGFLLAFSGGLTSIASAAPNAPTTCNGTLSGGPYFGVVVPADGSCLLINALVIGNVEARSGSQLIARSDRIIGNVIADHARTVQVFDGLVVGAITMDGVFGDFPPSGVSEVVVADLTVVGSITVTHSTGTILVDRNRVLAGNVTVTENFIPPFILFPSNLTVRLNRVTGDVTVSENVGPGDKLVHSNEVSGTVACVQNQEPFLGGPNSARRTVGQCF